MTQVLNSPLCEQFQSLAPSGLLVGRVHSTAPPTCLQLQPFLPVGTSDPARMHFDGAEVLAGPVAVAVGDIRWILPALLGIHRGLALPGLEATTDGHVIGIPDTDQLVLLAAIHPRLTYAVRRGSLGGALADAAGQESDESQDGIPIHVSSSCAPGPIGSKKGTIHHTRVQPAIYLGSRSLRAPMGWPWGVMPPVGQSARGTDDPSALPSIIPMRSHRVSS